MFPVPRTSKLPGMISVAKLTKSFGGVHAVRNLTFDVAPGKVTAFLGPNGAGKTTTLRMILGLVRPSSGAATIDGRAYADLRSPVRTVGAVLEATAFHPGRTARTHLRWLATAAGLSGGRVGEVLADVGLGDVADRRVGSFSLGMRQRLALASALLGEPSVLVLDEPANGLDPEGIHWLRAFLRAQAAEGRTVLVSSHVLTEIAMVADRVLIVSGGRLVADGGVEEFSGGGTGLEETYLELVRGTR
ncbi:putative ABC transporter ATP-binding protein YxlF [Amycolatopsis sp. CA-230715]|nr:putative ABC transporter ATP-binding protein YxlF [Amycolatopsis sp. CA-230715]